MKLRALGDGLQVSELGLGCMGFSHAYGAPTDRAEAIRVMEQAVEMGYTFFDTAESYTGENQDGSISYNEELVGEALRPHRNAVQIATKFGVRREGNELVVDSRPEPVSYTHLDVYKRQASGCGETPLRRPRLRVCTSFSSPPRSAVWKVLFRFW